jgi:hypothetical protein
MKGWNVGHISLWIIIHRAHVWQIFLTDFRFPCWCTSLWWSTWWANSSRSSGPIRWGVNKYIVMVVYLVGKQFQKLRTNQVRGQEIHCYVVCLPSGQTVTEAQDQSGKESINTLLWWSTWWANCSGNSGPIRWGVNKYIVMVVYLVGKQLQKLRINQVRGQKVHRYYGLPCGQTVPEAQD